MKAMKTHWVKDETNMRNRKKKKRNEAKNKLKFSLMMNKEYTRYANLNIIFLKKSEWKTVGTRGIYWRTENNISGICVLITGFRMFYKVRDDWRSEIVNDCCVFILRGPNNDLVSFFFGLMSVCISYIHTLMKNKNYNPFTVNRVQTTYK